MERFKKPKSEAVKEILKLFLLGGMIMIAATSPYFLVNLLRGSRRWEKYSRKKIGDTFSSLKNEGYIRVEEKNNQIYISLTEKGKQKAGKFQIDNLKIEKPKKWDKKWRLILFDIIELKKIYREALRGKLKELGFCPLQKSVWVIPWECEKEINLLREFFGLSENELRLVFCENIGVDENLRQYFKI